MFKPTYCLRQIAIILQDKRVKNAAEIYHSIQTVTRKYKERNEQLFKEFVILLLNLLPEWMYEEVLFYVGIHWR